MLNIANSKLENVVIHFCGNRSLSEGVILSDSPIDISDHVKSSLLNYFLSPFTKAEYYEFKHDVDLNINPLYNYCSKIFHNKKSFLTNSKNIVKHLYDCSEHPQIKGGEVFVSFITECFLDDDIFDAIVIVKSESKNIFLKVAHNNNVFDLEEDSGISLEKVDKACVVFNRGQESGYTVCFLDNTNKNSDALYWSDKFLSVQPQNDGFHKTQQFMSLCKSYIKDKLPEQFEVNRTDQIDLLNKSVEFFKSHDSFDYKSFTKEVIQEPHIIKSFGKYREEFEATNSFVLDDDFAISSDAVKRQAKIFKSIIKLDNNFQLYITGDRQMIEQGYDKERGLNFYKVYYKEER